MLKKKRKIIISILGVVCLFLISSHFSKVYASDLQNVVFLQGSWSKLIYVFAIITGIIIAPFETLPLLPIAVNLWGPLAAAIYSIIGWTGGAWLAFGIARLYGRRIVCRFVDPCELDDWKEAIPRRNVFWVIILARFIFPVDIISYLVGLFTKISWPAYVLATFLGIVPFSFTFAYGARLNIVWQLIVGALVLMITILGFNKIRIQLRQWNSDKLNSRKI